jgi:Bacteriocin-protection, YdeI or OmpD-Associated/Domain of unknown function (DUF1905)
MPAQSKPVRFMATLYKIWLMRHVNVPDGIANALRKQMGGLAAAKRRAGKRSKYIPVIATVGGKSVRTTIVPAGGGKYRMQINTAQRKAAGVDWGDPVTVELRLDLASRAVPVPAELRAALAKHPKARQGFDEMPPGHRRQFLLWFGSSKNPETHRKHLDRAIDHLIERVLMKPKPR